VLPKSSADQAIPRFTWWPRRGTKEWVAYQFESPREVSAVAVYWFDDTGRGHCRVPAAWHVEYHDGTAWRPVEARDPYTAEKDRFNRVRFKPVRTTKLRLVVQLQGGFSAGILEWQIEPPVK